MIDMLALVGGLCQARHFVATPPIDLKVDPAHSLPRLKKIQAPFTAILGIERIDVLLRGSISVLLGEFLNA
jgi:hypothetical protein